MSTHFAHSTAIDDNQTNSFEYLFDRKTHLSFCETSSNEHENKKIATPTSNVSVSM